MHRISCLQNYLKKQATPIKLNYLKLYNSDKYFSQTYFLKNELPIRLSHRVYNLIKLPYGLPQIPEIKNIIELYIDSFDRITKFNLTKISDIDNFTKLLQDIKDKHTNLEHSISHGIQKLDNYSLIDLSILNTELDNFFLSRIGIRTLITQQIEMVNNNKGLISDCNIYNIIQDTIYDVKYMTNRIYCDEPLIELQGDKHINIPYISSHLYYIILEILKNAVIAHFTNNLEETPINIQFTEGSDEIIIKISDKGPSFSKSHLNKLFTYSYSSEPIDLIENSELTNQPIMSGFGFGLPMSRLYCKYFGGDLIVNPMDGYGTDVYIYIHKLGENEELLYV